MINDFHVLYEIQTMFPPLAEHEYEGLKADIAKNGILSPVVLWNNTIIDGHHRAKIAEELGIEVPTVEMSFESINEACVWALNHQKNRRNLSAYLLGEITLKLKPVLEEQAKKRKSAAGGDRKSEEGKRRGPLVSMLTQATGKTRDTLANIAQISHGTMAKVEYIAEHADEETKRKLRCKEKGVSINGVYNELKAKEETQNSPIKTVPSTELTVMEPVTVTPKREENYLDTAPHWEPNITLNQISCVDPAPLVGAIFELFPDEYRSKFFSAFFDRFLYWQGKEETEKLFIQLAQTLNNSKTER